VALVEDVEEGEEAVPGDAHRRLEGDRDHPGEADEDLDRRDDDDEVLDRADRQPHEEVADPAREGEVQGVVLASAERARERPLQGAEQPDAECDAEDRELDVVRLPPGGAEEAAAAAVLAGGRARVVPLADRHEHEDADEAREGEEVGDPLEEEEVPDEWQRERGVDELAEGIEQGEEEDAEADHREPVRHRDDRQP
jgi:hypothetical protein